MAEVWDGFFDSTEDDERPLTAENFANYFRGFITDGVRNLGTNLQITEKEDMILQMNAGRANIQGYWYIQEEDDDGEYIEIELDESHDQYDRIDRVVLRLDRNITKRRISLIALRGTASESPIAPDMTRDETVYDICLAEVYVKANATKITRSNITDTRPDEAKCGIINSILGLDSSVWQKQFDDFMASLNTTFNEYLDKAYDSLKEIFDEQMNEIEAWFISVKTDITRLQSFNFDNLAELNGCTRTTTKSGSTITEKIFITLNNTMVAQRVTTKSGSTITEKVIVYERNGTDIMKQAEITTTKSGSTYKEVVV